MISKPNRSPRGPILPFLLLLLSTADASHVVSGTTARLPMSLSTVIQDLEAEGASYVTTAAFLTSQSVRRSTCSSLLRSLFSISGEGDHDDEVIYGETTAFGKKLDDDDDDEGSDADGGGSGVAIACPSRGEATVSEVSSTVVACGGTVVYVADEVDLGRGEGLFDALGPAVERLLAARAAAESGDGGGGTTLKHRPSTLIVVFTGAASAAEIESSRRLFEASAAKMLRSIIQPVAATSHRATKLSDVFDRIEYVSSNEKDVDMQLCPAGGKVGRKNSPSAREPAEVAGSVRTVVEAGLVENVGPMVEMAAKVPVKQACPRLMGNAVDLAAARVLGPLAKTCLEECLSLVRTSCGADGKKVVPEFGSLCDASVSRALRDFDAAASKTKRFQKSPVAKRIRADLLENLHSELSDVYDVQVSALQAAAFDAFRARLNKLRITPNLANDMNDAAKTSLDEFATAAKKLRPSSSASASWTGLSDQIANVRTKFARHNAERLLAARASGQFRPVPRKGVTVGMHWLLPKPFGNDYRQEPWLEHTADDLVFAPVDGVTDVGGGDVRTGDWRKGVVPAPTSGEMMYLK
mmetsp:Transcript_21170/g.43050  ORF Transcript_21170/g.43050 Transcript_21170/m.43050 type:complete len:581 (-) Transcript_21170:317-2059(-)